MSTYFDPVSALVLARQSRAEEMRSAEQYHLARGARPGRPAKPPRPRWRLTWRRPVLAP